MGVLMLVVLYLAFHLSLPALVNSQTVNVLRASYDDGFRFDFQPPSLVSTGLAVDAAGDIIVADY